MKLLTSLPLPIVTNIVVYPLQKKSSQRLPIRTAAAPVNPQIQEVVEEADKVTYEEEDEEFDEDSSQSSCGLITPDPVSTGSGIHDEVSHDHVEPLLEETRRNYHGGLSPVQESPEYHTGSPDSINVNFSQLESDLNTALSVLSSEMKEMEETQEVVERSETQITQTVLETRETAGGGNNEFTSSDASFEGG